MGVFAKTIASNMYVTKIKEVSIFEGDQEIGCVTLEKNGAVKLNICSKQIINVNWADLTDSVSKAVNLIESHEKQTQQHCD